MRKNEVEIGGVYTAKISGRLVRVRLESANRHGGWTAMNLDTKRRVRIRSAAKLREAVSEGASPAHATKRKRTRKAKDDGGGKMSCIDAAIKVLAETREPLNTKQMIEAMGAKGYWKSPGGKTPHATLHAAISREIKTKGKQSRFRKADRGKFTLA